ncbi:MAG: hypothetical protein FK734_19545 [Asgard group archaeon]|nr:hypothetical protein [Asgard group archaeon]
MNSIAIVILLSGSNNRTLIIIILAVMLFFATFITLGLLSDDLPIVITRNDDFLNITDLGSGTIDDPFIIQNRKITTTLEYGILIQDTSVFFIIRNCYVSAKIACLNIVNAAPNTAIVEDCFFYDNDFYGMAILICPGIIIRNNEMADVHDGIGVGSSDNCLITDNVCINTYFDITIAQSEDAIIQNNYIDNGNGIIVSNCDNCLVINNVLRGLSVYSSYATTIANNTIIETQAYSYRGFSPIIYVRDSLNTTFEDNIVKGYQSRTVLEQSLNTTLIDNIFIDAAITINEYFLDYLLSYIIQNSTLNSKDILLLKNKNNLTIDNDQTIGQLIMINCSNIDLYDLSFNSIALGLELYYCSNISINQGNFDAISWVGLFVQFSSQITINHNSFTNCDYAIDLFITDNSTLTDNLLIDCIIGFNLELGTKNTILANNTFTGSLMVGLNFFSAENNTVIGNYISNARHGLIITDSSDFIIENNTFMNNKVGLLFWTSTDCLVLSNNFLTNYYSAIELEYSENFIILNNTIKENGFGIKVTFLDNSIIRFNHFELNTNYSLYMNDYSENNTIYQNNFIDNYIAPTLFSQAIDNGINNLFYDVNTNTGNFWSNWISSFYSIDGVANNIDIYPLVNPIEIK